MRRAVIVIGCSYGDEGKGLAAAFSAKRLGGACLNVLINGGAQRGHTVDLPDGRRHVFRHYGSAALSGAASYADEDFIVNPLVYVRERGELRDTFGFDPLLMASDRCRVSLPWDMMLGQIIEEHRGAARHGSCGMGIYETRRRFEVTPWALRYGDLARIGEGEFADYCFRVREEYLPERLASLGVKAGPEWLPVLRDPGIVRHAWDDMEEMRGRVKGCGSWTRTASPYDALVFEAGQGLALDEENKKDSPHLTPSRTTSLISARRIAQLPGGTDAQILYVTRTYLTRHGAGPFPTECPREAVGQIAEDKTNVPNPHQQTLRYGMFDVNAVLGRVRSDMRAAREVLPRVRTAVLVTHLNETGGRLACAGDMADLTGAFDEAYFSSCPFGVDP